MAFKTKKKKIIKKFAREDNIGSSELNLNENILKTLRSFQTS
ncbi:MAG: hypothetical protein CM15mP104_0640 [Gammaproteobacteria bacterium]|nr:MAG: hypothetical protein CM15mP104_0640 [Gammaproteobacteria bacterium]